MKQIYERKGFPLDKGDFVKLVYSNDYDNKQSIIIGKIIISNPSSKDSNSVEVIRIIKDDCNVYAKSDKEETHIDGDCEQVYKLSRDEKIMEML